MSARFRTLLQIIIATIIGSFIAIFATDMLMADIGSMSVGPLIFCTLTSLMMDVNMVIVFLGSIRMYLRPKTRKKATKLYALLVAIFSGIGALSALLSGLIEYHSFVKPYPFTGYLIIFMILHVLTCAACIYVLVSVVKKLPDDEEVVKVDAKHVFETIGLFLFISLCLNRIGNLFGSFFFTQWRLFGLTFVFYLYMVTPILIGLYMVLHMLGYLKNKKFNFVAAIVIQSFNVALFVAIVILGCLRSDFISAVSPAMGLERLASMPIEIIVHFLAYTAVCTILIVKSAKEKSNVQ